MYVIVAKTSEIKEGRGKTISVSGKNIAIFNIKGSFFAVDDSCLHMGGPLGEGMLDQNVVTCPWHGWQYDVMSGASVQNPDVRLGKYPVKVEEGMIKVEVG